MKPRLIATLVIVALVGAMTFVATRFALISDVSPEDFDAFISEHAPSRVDARQTSQTSHTSPLPLLVSIRFPMSDSKGGLGFPDRTQVSKFVDPVEVNEQNQNAQQVMAGNPQKLHNLTSTQAQRPGACI